MSFSVSDKEPRRVTIVTTVHPPGDVRIFWKEAVSLARSGAEVHFMAFDSVRKRDEVSGIQRHLYSKPPLRLWLANKLRRYFVVARALWKSKKSTSILHDPELIPLGILLKLRGWKVIYDSHEDFPEQIAAKPYLPRFAVPILQFGARGLLFLADRCFDGVACATNTIQNRFKCRTALVRNFPLLEEFPVTLPGEKEIDLLVYIGGLTRLRGVIEMVKAVNKMREPARLALAGPWESPQFQNEAMAADTGKRVTYLGTLERPDVSSLLRRATIGLVVLHPTEAYKVSLPVKMFEYMASGVAVVASNFPYWESIIDDANCGITVEPGDVGGLAECLDELMACPEQCRRYGESGRRAVEEKYSWERESITFVEFVRGIATEGGAVS